MAMHTRRIGGLLPRIRIASGEYLEDFDIEGVGHDDGTDHDPAGPFRSALVHPFCIEFALGRVVDFYEYRIEVTGPALGGASHTLSLVDSAASVIDPETYGAPHRVECPTVVLPPVYERVQVTRYDGSVDSFAIDSMTFESHVAREGEPAFVASWRARDERGESFTLRYSRSASWSLERANSAGTRTEVPRVTFSGPLGIRR